MITTTSSPWQIPRQIFVYPTCILFIKPNKIKIRKITNRKTTSHKQQQSKRFNESRDGQQWVFFAFGRRWKLQTLYINDNGHKIPMSKLYSNSYNELHVHKRTHTQPLRTHTHKIWIIRTQILNLIYCNSTECHLLSIHSSIMWIKWKNQFK